MKNLLKKEIRLASSPITWVFILFGALTMIPGYIILLGAFFVCLGLFHSYQNARENGDVMYTMLLPVKKSDYVRAKYTFTVMIQMLAFALMLVLTIVRMTVLGFSITYITNEMMNATPFYLAFVLLVFMVFNLIFVGGFFKSGYKIGLPYLIFCIVTFGVVLIGEAVHHFPQLAFLNAPWGERLGLQWGIFAAAAVLYVVATLLSMKLSIRRFELIDL